MKYLYNKNDLNKLLSKKAFAKKMIFIISIIFVIEFTIFLIIANYHSRTIIQIVGSIISTLLVFLIIFYVGLFTYYKRICNEYNILLTSKDEKGTYEFKDISVETITLSDKSKVYEIKANRKDGSGCTLYLSEMFDNDLFTPGKYKFSTVFDYITGYEREN